MEVNKKELGKLSIADLLSLRAWYLSTEDMYKFNVVMQEVFRREKLIFKYDYED